MDKKIAFRSIFYALLWAIQQSGISGSFYIMNKKKQFLLVIIRFTENSEKTNGDVLSKVNYQTETISLTMIHWKSLVYI